MRDVIIIGAGAAGLMCAIECGKRGRSTLLLDHAPEIGKKIRASGGGRCNFTNILATPANFLSENPHFCISALSRFTPVDVIALFEKHGVAYEERERGQLFCLRSAREVVALLEKECRDAGVETMFGCRVLGARKEGGAFTVTTDRGEESSASLVIATGGLSYPKLGATGMGYRLAESFGLRVTELRPALVPFLLSDEEFATLRELSGVSLEAGVACRGVEFRAALLFTHVGLSGPAILQISSYWREGDVVVIDLLPGVDILEILTTARRERGDTEIHNVLAAHLPARFARAWCARHLTIKPLRQYAEKELVEMARRLHAWEIVPRAVAGYDKAEVTLGGVDTNDLSSRTMEARNVKGLYCIGEVVDVTGQLGGFNFQWAWASGFVAGQSA